MVAPNIIIITRPVGNVGMGVNVIVATVPSNSEVPSLRWMSLNMVTIVRAMVTVVSYLCNIDGDKVGHLGKVLAQFAELEKFT